MKEKKKIPWGLIYVGLTVVVIQHIADQFLCPRRKLLDFFCNFI